MSFYVLKILFMFMKYKQLKVMFMVYIVQKIANQNILQLMASIQIDVKWAPLKNY